MNEELVRESLSYAVHHPYQAIGLIAIVFLFLVLAYFTIYFGLKLRDMSNKVNGDGNGHKCQCSLILPQITQINGRLIHQDKKIDSINRKFDTMTRQFYSIEAQVKFLYTKFNNK